MLMLGLGQGRRTGAPKAIRPYQSLSFDRWWKPLCAFLVTEYALYTPCHLLQSELFDLFVLLFAGNFFRPETGDASRSRPYESIA